MKVISHRRHIVSCSIGNWPLRHLFPSRLFLHCLDRKIFEKNIVDSNLNMNGIDSLPMEEVLTHIELSVLPTADDRYIPINRRKRKDDSGAPHARLDHILYQVALADHIRMMQIMYRDSEDEQGLAPELREGDTTVKLPTKHLMEKLVEGRSRVVALCRTCYGDDSFESLRASVDLASAYALQGMWQQVITHVAVASNLLQMKEEVSDIRVQRTKQSRGKQAASRVRCCYSVLRAHALLNGGQISTVFVQELMKEMTASFTGDGENTLETLGTNNITKLTSELYDFFQRFSVNRRDGNSPSSEEKHKEEPNNILRRDTPSWGDLINFFRDESFVMNIWMTELNQIILPQNKAALHLCFRICDDQRKGVAHPLQLAGAYTRFSNALKVLAGTDLLKQLKDCKVETPVVINYRTGALINSSKLNNQAGTKEKIIS